MISLVLSCLFFLNTGFETWVVTSTDACFVGCHARSRHHLVNPKHLVVLTGGPISHYSIHLLIDDCYRFCHTVLIYWICRFPYYFISYGCWVWRPIFAQLSEVLSCVSCVKLGMRSFCYYQNGNPLYQPWASSHILDNVG